MRLERLALGGPRGRVPKLYRPVEAARGKEPAIGAERDRIDRTRVGLPEPREGSLRPAPQLHGAVPAAQGDGLSARGERKSVDRPLQAPGLAERLMNAPAIAVRHEIHRPVELGHGEDGTAGMKRE